MKIYQYREEMLAHLFITINRDLFEPLVDEHKDYGLAGKGEVHFTELNDRVQGTCKKYYDGRHHNKDETRAHIEISPTLDDETVISVLVHELIHDFVWELDLNNRPHCGHFLKVAKKIGLIAPFTSTRMSKAMKAYVRLLLADTEWKEIKGEVTQVW